MIPRSQRSVAAAIAQVDLELQPVPRFRFCVHAPLTLGASSLGSVDGHALQIDELKGTKPTEKIDLSRKGLGVASAIIIAACIKENGVLKELK